MYKSLRVSAVIPAFNEERAIGKVVSSLLSLRDGANQRIIDDLVVCDNASSDSTGQLAAQSGARVVREEARGYGAACQAALAHIQACDIVLFVDGDDSCFADQAERLLQGIVDGDDVAIGSRALGHMERGALTPVQRFGNSLSAFLIRALWRTQMTDLGPFRAVRTSALQRINMQDKTFGWTVELQIKAIQLGLRMTEYPVDSKVRIGESKISGTVKGSILAGIGILSKIFLLRYRQEELRRTARRRSTQ